MWRKTRLQGALSLPCSSELGSRRRSYAAKLSPYNGSWGFMPNSSRTRRQNETPMKKSSFGSLFWWFLLVCIVLLAWPVLDASTGPAQPVKGMVTANQRGKGGSVSSEISFPDGSVVRKSSADLIPVGSLVSCVRYLRRLSGRNNYEC